MWCNTVMQFFWWRNQNIHICFNHEVLLDKRCNQKNKHDNRRKTGNMMAITIYNVFLYIFIGFQDNLIHIVMLHNASDPMKICVAVDSVDNRPQICMHCYYHAFVSLMTKMHVCTMCIQNGQATFIPLHTSDRCTTQYHKVEVQIIIHARFH